MSVRCEKTYVKTVYAPSSVFCFELEQARKEEKDLLTIKLIHVSIGKIKNLIPANAHR